MTMTHSRQGFDAFLMSYIETALWSSVVYDDAGYSTPLDEVVGRGDLAEETLVNMTEDCRAFYNANRHLWANHADDYHAGHDFWLTRNRHGAGFWDGDYPDAIGRELTDLAHVFGECDLYIGDDGKVYAP